EDCLCELRRDGVADLQETLTLAALPRVPSRERLERGGLFDGEAHVLPSCGLVPALGGVVVPADHGRCRVCYRPGGRPFLRPVAHYPRRVRRVPCELGDGLGATGLGAATRDGRGGPVREAERSEEHTSELQSRENIVM